MAKAVTPARQFVAIRLELPGIDKDSSMNSRHSRRESSFVLLDARLDREGAVASSVYRASVCFYQR
ncbi:MAG TPA: hypothetical protein VGV35_13080 [Bryobacteraceae bacterium]|nr:hypothetical protein [Bryobacteraceae bacterium]